ncbi:TAP42-like protein [Parasitella parasitica]|nr:TAP42-like protein [Parasitella parasitica]
MTTAAQLDGLSLGELFRIGQSVLTELEDSHLSSTDPEYQAQVAKGLQMLTRADDLVGKLAIFSDNEILEDINTNDLKFLMVPAYLGNLTLKMNSPDRRSVLETSREHLERFLGACQDHALVQKQDLRLMEQLQHKAPSVAASQQRDQKIARFKRERDVKQQISQLRQQLDSVANEENEDRDVDDLERKWVEALIELEILKALETWHAIEQEMVMVKEMEAMKEMREKTGRDTSLDERQEPRSSRATWGENKPILSKEGRPLQPFVITNKREQLKNQVFGYSHNLPTMTIDEYLDQEMERGNIIQGGGEEPEKPEIDDNDYEAQDADTLKKREWDEFVDANPRGAGNRGNKG